MRAFLKDQSVFLTLIGLAAIGLAGLGAWQLFFCPECLASRQKSSFSSNSLGNSEPQIASEENPISEEQKSNQKLDTAPRVGSLAPPLVLENLDGDKVSLSDFSSKNILLVFWATSCGWCEKERPDLIKFTEEQRGKIEILAVSTESRETLKKYVEEKQINFTVLSDPKREAQTKYLAFGTPGHFLIDKQSKIVAARPGYANYDDLLKLAQSLEE